MPSVPALGHPEGRPTVLGRYELVAPIGRGGMAEVHLAIQRGPAGFEKLAVIKLVHEHLASQASFVEMLLDEARHAGMIKHPNVVEIYELGEEAGRYFIAMEYLEGEPLLEVLRRSGDRGPRLDPLSTARVIADTAEGLDAAHRLKARDGRPIELVHHDVSLGNIVVLYSGLVKLVDFGVAKVQKVQKAASGARVQGKLGYMAPEKVTDRGVDRRCDIWSLGCVLWEALTLRRLFKGDTDAETVRQVLEAEIEPPSAIEPSAPRELDPIVMRALERDPDRRYQTAKALAADLEEVLRERKYGAKNDRIAQHMEAVFASRIAARERVLRDVSSKRRPSAETLDAAFGEAITPAASTSSSADDEPAHETTTMKTAPNPEGWKPDTPPAPVPVVAPAPAPPPPPPAPREGRQLSPSAFSQPRPRSTGPSVTPKPFSVASLLDDPDAAAEPIRPPAPALAIGSAPSRPSSQPEPAPWPAPPVTPEVPVVPAPPRVAPVQPWRGDVNPFEEDQDLQTVADVIPANAEASRSLQSAPSWTVARQSVSLGELQRWVQESRNPPKSRREAVARGLRQWHQRLMAWAYRHRLPRWLPYAAVAVALVWLVLLVTMCAGG
jgi:serine/threonine-protein kinase